MRYLIITVCLLLVGFLAIFLAEDLNEEKTEIANSTSYEITINNKDTYFCEDYKLSNAVYTIEGTFLDEYKIDDYVFIYEDGNETISSDTVNSFKVKEIKTNLEDNASENEKEE